jgi:hypothetical protein
MAFRINKSIIQGTSKHTSALKQTTDVKKLENPKIKKIEKIDHSANLKKITDKKKRREYYKTHNLKQDRTTTHFFDWHTLDKPKKYIPKKRRQNAPKGFFEQQNEEMRKMVMNKDFIKDKFGSR